MQEPIDRHDLKNYLYRVQAEAFKYSEWYIAGAIQSFIDLLDKQPTIEAEPVRHGRWILLPNRTAPSKLFKCSECGNVTEHEHFSRNGYYPFCKDCGAKMGKGDENE